MDNDESAAVLSERLFDPASGTIAVKADVVNPLRDGAVRFPSVRRFRYPLITAEETVFSRAAPFAIPGIEPRRRAAVP
jgi:hypothetical protein